LRIINLASHLPSGRTGEVIGAQVLKSGTSIGANWRKPCRGSSRRHFATTVEVCIQEADETLYWLELLAESEIVKPQRLTGLADECNQLIAILTATAKRAKRNPKQEE
jgi:four helix bundle protein